MFRALTTCKCHGVPGRRNKVLSKKLSPRQLHHVSTFNRQRVDGECYNKPKLIEQMTEKAEENMISWCERYRATGEVCDLEQCILWGNTYMRYGKHIEKEDYYGDISDE